ncbi:histidine phosphatase family protein [Hypericibacter sp.]|uniref:histidine phosphatase family protein n=1 Tax=Hypericibacter sp. TaxID=2705401 RepID=UPI003D6D0E91
MTPTLQLALLRHGPTAWNRSRRIQGLTDEPLDEAGRAHLESWRLPEHWVARPWVTSPLRRCRETAAILARTHRREGPIAVEPRLIEMSHGEWEGERLADLRARLGEGMTALEDRGLDYRAPGGESPREVQQRLRPWLQEIAAAGSDRLAIAHRGIMRALYAMAVGWDMTGKPPVKLRDDCLQLFVLASGGQPHVERLNVSLIHSAEPGTTRP